MMGWLTRTLIYDNSLSPQGTPPNQKLSHTSAENDVMGAHDMPPNQILKLESQFTSPAQPMDGATWQLLGGGGGNANGNGATNLEHCFEEIKTSFK